MVISFTTGTDSITIKNYFSGNGYVVENIVFADGNSWLPQDVQGHFEDGIPMPVFRRDTEVMQMEAMLRAIEQSKWGSAEDDAQIVNTPVMLASTPAIFGSMNER